MSDPNAGWRERSLKPPSEAKPVHPTHDPDPLVAARLVAFGSTTWCRNCDHLVADGSMATDVGAQPCPAYQSKLIITGTGL